MIVQLNSAQLLLSAACTVPAPLSGVSPIHVSLLVFGAQNPNVWAQKGHLCYLQKDFVNAKECYERVISFVEDAEDMHFVYLRLGSIYLEEKEVRSQQGCGGEVPTKQITPAAAVGTVVCEPHGNGVFGKPLFVM